MTPHDDLLSTCTIGPRACRLQVTELAAGTQILSGGAGELSRHSAVRELAGGPLGVAGQQPFERRAAHVEHVTVLAERRGAKQHAPFETGGKRAV